MIQLFIRNLFQAEQAKEAKLKRKKLLKEKSKLLQKMKLGPGVKGDIGPTVIETKNMFSLKQIKSAQVRYRFHSCFCSAALKINCK